MARNRYSAEETKTNQTATDARPDDTPPGVLQEGIDRPDDVQGDISGAYEKSGPDNRLDEEIKHLNARIKEAEAGLEALKRRHRQMKEEKRRADAADVGESRVSALKRASDLLAKDTTAAKSADANRMRQLRQQVADLAQKA